MNEIRVQETQIDGHAVKLTVKKHSSMGHYCGYCEFDFAPFADIPSDVIYEIDVYGGVTLWDTYEFGFDCAHLGDDTNPQTRNIAWLMIQAEHMAKQIVEITSAENKQRVCNIIAQLAIDGNLAEIVAWCDGTNKWTPPEEQGQEPS